MISTNRRQFLSVTGLIIGGSALGTLWPQAVLAAPPPLVDLKDPTAKAVMYVEDHKKAPQAKGHHCATCSFYKKGEIRNGKEVGSCLIFAGKYVLAEGYCNSWAKK
jgi:hypothetical protein